MKFVLPLFCTLLLASACNSRQQQCELCTGDLIFLRDTTGMGQSVAQSTGQYTHVAIAQCTDSGLYVVEAVPRRGVIRRPYTDFAQDYVASLCHPADFYRISCHYDTAHLNRQFQNLLCKPYDDYFLPQNGRLYCSELVYESFRDSLGAPLFHTHPMNFLASDSSLPTYWQQLFDSLDIAVPQGVPGTNPTDLSQEPFLTPVNP